MRTVSPSAAPLDSDVPPSGIHHKRVRPTGPARRVPSDEGQILQLAREEAGLSREELGRRYALALVVARARAFNAAGYSVGEVDRLARIYTPTIQKHERSRNRGPDGATLSTLLALTDAGGPGTSDAQVIEHYQDFRDSHLVIRLQAAVAEGEALARTIELNADCPSQLEPILNDEIAEVINRPRGSFEDPDYAPTSGAVKLRAAFLALAAQIEKASK